MAKSPEEKVSYTCPECGQKYRVPKRYSNVPRCPKCRKAALHPGTRVLRSDRENWIRVDRVKGVLDPEHLDEIKAHAEVTTSGLTQCPDCGGKISTIASTCPHCGRPSSWSNIRSDSFAKPVTLPATGGAPPASESERLVKGEHRTSAYCEQCEEQRLCTKQSPNHILHLLLSIVTAGLWLLIWALVCMSAESKPFCCSVCGNKVQMPQAPTPWRLLFIVFFVVVVVILFCVVALKS